MASKSAEPNSSYKYFESSSRCPGLVRLSRTSLANSARWRVGVCAGAAAKAAAPELLGGAISPALFAAFCNERSAVRAVELRINLPRAVFIFSLPRNGKWRRCSDNAAETNCGKIAATCRQLSGGSRLSSRNAGHQKNWLNIRDKTNGAGNLQKAQRRFASTPNRCRRDHAHRTRWRPRDARRRARDPSSENQNFHVPRWEWNLPTDIGAPLLLSALRRRHGEIVPRSAAGGLAILHTRQLPHG